MNKKTRLDAYLAEHNISDSREKAKKEIIAGWVKVDGETVRVPSRTVTGTENISVQRPGGIFVSRGGEKLEKALTVFHINVNGKTILDLGSSTGGFTDCLLKKGAGKVYAVDVGYGQLDYRLRQDSRVVVMERTNARDLTIDSFQDEIDLITADLSFISIVKVVTHLVSIFSNINSVLLIKPQFEAEYGQHKKGVVRNKTSHVAILNNVLRSLTETGVVVHDLTYSPITGPKGNIEFLCYCTINPCSNINNQYKQQILESIDTIVNDAHNYFV